LVLLPCPAGKRSPGRRAVEIDIETLKSVLLHGFAGTNGLFDRFGFDEKVNEAITRGVAAMVREPGLDIISGRGNAGGRRCRRVPPRTAPPRPGSRGEIERPWLAVRGDRNLRQPCVLPGPCLVPWLAL
jgi:hypothetical protein